MPNFGSKQVSTVQTLRWLLSVSKNVANRDISLVYRPFEIQLTHAEWEIVW